MPIDVTPTTPTTLLEALNRVLEAARVSRVSSLSAVDLHEDANGAKAAIDDVSREVQMEGWEFNTEREYPITPDGSGYLTLPNNTLKVNSTRYQSGNRLVQRGTRLYDPKLHTDVFTEDAEVDIVLALEFDDLPMSAKAYITALAARRWALPKLPEGATFRYTEEVIGSARAQMERDDADVRDEDLEASSPHFAMHRRR